MIFSNKYLSYTFFRPFYFSDFSKYIYLEKWANERALDHGQNYHKKYDYFSLPCNPRDTYRWNTFFYPTIGPSLLLSSLYLLLQYLSKSRHRMEQFFLIICVVTVQLSNLNSSVEMPRTIFKKKEGKEKRYVNQTSVHVYMW